MASKKNKMITKPNKIQTNNTLPTTGIKNEIKGLFSNFKSNLGKSGKSLEVTICKICNFEFKGIIYHNCPKSVKPSIKKEFDENNGISANEKIIPLSSVNVDNTNKMIGIQKRAANGDTISKNVNVPIITGTPKHSIQGIGSVERVECNICYRRFKCNKDLSAHCKAKHTPLTLRKLTLQNVQIVMRIPSKKRKNNVLPKKPTLKPVKKTSGYNSNGNIIPMSTYWYFNTPETQYSPYFYPETARIYGESDSKNHEFSFAVNTPRIKCDLCNRNFKDERSIMLHTRAEHNGYYMHNYMQPTIPQNAMTSRYDYENHGIPSLLSLRLPPLDTWSDNEGVKTPSPRYWAEHPDSEGVKTTSPRYWAEHPDSEGVKTTSPRYWAEHPDSEGVRIPSPRYWAVHPESEGVQTTSPRYWAEHPDSEGVKTTSPRYWAEHPDSEGVRIPSPRYWAVHPESEGVQTTSPRYWAEHPDSEGVKTPSPPNLPVQPLQTWTINRTEKPSLLNIALYPLQMQYLALNNKKKKQQRNNHYLENKQNNKALENKNNPRKNSSPAIKRPLPDRSLAITRKMPRQTDSNLHTSASCGVIGPSGGGPSCTDNQKTDNIIKNIKVEPTYSNFKIQPVEPYSNGNVDPSIANVNVGPVEPYSNGNVEPSIANVKVEPCSNGNVEPSIANVKVEPTLKIKLETIW